MTDETNNVFLLNTPLSLPVKLIEKIVPNSVKVRPDGGSFAYTSDQEHEDNYQLYLYGFREKASKKLVALTGKDESVDSFIWKKLPKATKYHLYVSDDDEILIDEYETEQETAYVLKKSLDPVKTYHWKVVITLEDGSTVIGDSQKFTIKNFQQNQKKLERKEKSDNRCLQQN